MPAGRVWRANFTRGRSRSCSAQWRREKRSLRKQPIASERRVSVGRRMSSLHSTCSIEEKLISSFSETFTDKTNYKWDGFRRWSRRRVRVVADVMSRVKTLALSCVANLTRKERASESKSDCAICVTSDVHQTRRASPLYLQLLSIHMDQSGSWGAVCRFDCCSDVVVSGSSVIVSTQSWTTDIFLRR